MIDDIKKNIGSEIEMLKEISIYANRIERSSPKERELILPTINALIDSMKIVNNSIPALLGDITLANKLPTNSEIKKEKTIERINYRRAESEFMATIRVKDKGKLFKQLNITESNIKKLRKRGKRKKEEYAEFKAARGYMKLSNRFFLNTAGKLTKKGYFKVLSKELRKANIDVLFQSYIAMIITTSVLSLIIGIVLSIFLMFFNIGIDWPFVSIYQGSYLMRAFIVIWIPIILPILVFGTLYIYPTTEKGTISKKVNQELSFAVIHMSAISGSGIQPSEIFRIIGLSKEYPHLRKEIRKVLNQINLYGYDLVTALNNAASTTSSDKLAELFFGLATTINSGGEFSEFFNKRAETLLTDYRLERQKYAKNAETFMDIYISVVIAAPMILMLFLILLTIGNFDVGLSLVQLSVLVILVMAMINVFFLLFIHLNQPSY